MTGYFRNWNCEKCGDRQETIDYPKVEICAKCEKKQKIKDGDFRILQTYSEIKQQIETSAYIALVDDSQITPPTKGEMDWAEKTAKIISQWAMNCFDGDI